MRDVRGDAARNEREVLPKRGHDPLLGIRGVRRQQWHVVAGPREIGDAFADDLAQELLRSSYQPLGFDLQRDGLVEPRLNLLNVGDRDQADLEAPLRLLELAFAGLSRNDCRR